MSVAYSCTIETLVVDIKKWVIRAKYNVVQSFLWVAFVLWRAHGIVLIPATMVHPASVWQDSSINLSLIHI